MDNAVSPEIDQAFLAGLYLQWNSLLRNQKLNSFGEGEINEEGFIKAVRDTYYYFKNCLEARCNKSDYSLTMLSVDEAKIVAQICAYSNQIICTESEMSQKCEIMQFIAYDIYSSIVTSTNPPLWGFSNAPIIKDGVILDSGEDLDYEYDVDKGNLQEIFDLFANR